MTRISAAALVAVFLCACTSETTDGPVPDAGERMYRDGILASGEPMTALVGGDIPIVGTQFSCESCHGRSGMGAAEGPYVVPPVAGQFLFAPSPQPARPAYDRDSIATLLRSGITPSGRVLSPQLMPRYVIDDANVDLLAGYLENLSSTNSPGVDDETIRFATVVTADADPAEVRAVLSVLQRFAEDINRQTRNEGGRWDRGYTPESKLPTVFRRWVIDEWVLEGEPNAWSQQLDARYAENPVFAIISGTGEGSWRPVGEFCERNKVACLYPSTDLPWHEADDFYTVYFSAGLLLEARLMAAHIEERSPANVVQVYCDPDYEAAAALLRESLDNISTHLVRFDCERPLPVEHVESISGADSVIVLWLDDEQLAGLRAAPPVGSLYLSSTLTSLRLPQVVTEGREVFVAHPFRLPGQFDPAMRRFEAWAGNRGVAITAPRKQAEAYFACLVLKDAVKHLGRFFIREFALDMLDHAESLGAYIPFYEQPSFGPGQRFISKGGYILPVVDGELDTQGADWILP